MGFWNNPVFWVIAIVVAFAGWRLISKYVRGIPVLRTKQGFIVVGLIGLGVTTGFLATLGIGSLTPGAEAVQIADIQVTTAFGTDAGGTACTADANPGVDDLMHCRFTDIQANETTGVYEIDDGILTITRGGSLEANSCPVVARVDTYQSEATPGDGSMYKIVEETSNGELEVYLDAQKSGSASAAATTDPKERTTLEFAEGISKAHLGVLAEVDEEGHDELNTYSYRDIVLDICGKPFVLRVHNMG